MRTGRSDYDALFHETSIPSNEPRFFLRAQDRLAAEGVRAYAQLARDHDLHPALVESALQQADAMDAWPVKKLPDPGFIPRARWEQLAYQLGRRQWNGGELTLTGLAERRGRNEVLALVAPVIAALTAGDGGRFTYDPPECGPDPLALLAQLLADAESGPARPPASPYVEFLERELRAARARAAPALLSVIEDLVAIRPENWDDDEDPEQAVAWRAADVVLSGGPNLSQEANP